MSSDGDSSPLTPSIQSNISQSELQRDTSLSCGCGINFKRSSLPSRSMTESVSDLVPAKIAYNAFSMISRLYGVGERRAFLTFSPAAQAWVSVTWQLTTRTTKT
mgnify:CR=1 FL=1